MGSCFRGQIKAKRAPRHGIHPDFGGKDGNVKFMSNWEEPPSTTLESDALQLQQQKPKSFSLSELKAATRDFHPDGLVGEGASHIVLKGWIDKHSLAASRPDKGLAVAVKLFKPKYSQSHQEWLTEIKYLGHLDHPNLVRLIGYCWEDDHHLLVFEFVPKGGLDLNLFGRLSKVKPLPWNLRMKIALGAAKTLAFLHKEVQVIYPAVNASKILLDSSYNIKLTDFGLAKDEAAGDNISHVTTMVPFSAPEDLSIGHLPMKSIVYKFGVVLLQMLSGRQAIDHSRPLEEQDLVEWARPYLDSKRKIFRILDANFEGQYPPNALLKVADLIVKCLSTEPKCRPDMEDVVKALEQVYSPA